MEVWKKITGFEDYEVSNYGNVRSLKCNKIRLLKQENNRGNNKGFYKRVSFCKNNSVTRFQVHRLVAIYFLKNNENKKCVNHIDGNPGNNNVSNLEWCTHSENERHSYDILGKKNSNRKLNEIQVKDIIENCVKANRKNIILFPGNVFSFMLKYNVDRKTILNVLNKKYYVQN
jgi:hypothetical protein